MKKSLQRFWTHFLSAEYSPYNFKYQNEFVYLFVLIISIAVMLLMKRDTKCINTKDFSIFIIIVTSANLGIHILWNLKNYKVSCNLNNGKAVLPTTFIKVLNGAWSGGWGRALKVIESFSQLWFKNSNEAVWQVTLSDYKISPKGLSSWQHHKP